MKERPILFSGEMVRAILAGRKTQTRRAVNPRHVSIVEECFKVNGKWCNYTFGYDLVELNRYGSLGDRLWVKETFRQGYAATAQSSGIIYRADAEKSLGMDEYSNRHKWKPSIFMPRKASRITLEIVNVRVERLHDITEDDAMAEGAKCPGCESTEHEPCSYRNGYKSLWESINGAGSWANNPWVWVIEFKKL